MVKNVTTQNVKFSDRFDDQLKDVPDEIKEAFLESFALFLEDQNHPSLRNHVLKEKFAGYRSIDITGDYRAVFKETKARKQKVITFHMLGTHEELYGS
ncbi:MAG: type II toxin-antitoxin system mRNA interferase toxin, RelE/StbE family [Candidatus Levybacteria bacterium]|nr:type II toxin-antitoxin system mRNA interferase toxin, RelE/StbE family [Candidatus Levybacteria bacterium]